MNSLDFLALAKKLEPEIIAWRRHFHLHPELSFEEFETSRYVAARLIDMGCKNVNIGTYGRPTGVIADIIGGFPGKNIALRADIDALPVKEESEVEFRSLNVGVMHACGHDGHIAMLLGAAKMLCEVKDKLHGSVRLVFQPSEESADFMQGAAAVVKDGRALAGVDAILGVHLMASFPDGKLGYNMGPMMACSDSWEINITGKGGHGASPHETHDPMMAAGQLICALQTFVSRELNPIKSAVLSIGIVKSGTAFNVIPAIVEMVGTARSFEKQVSYDIEAFIRRMAENICAAFRCKAEVTYHRNLPPTVNTPEMALLGSEVGREIFGKENVEETIPTLGGEDFAWYLQNVPGAFFFIGVRDEAKGTSWPHHHSHFAIDEDVLYKGAAFEASCAWKFLNGK